METSYGLHPTRIFKDYFQWRYLKTKDFQNQSPKKVETLKERIRQKINIIQAEMLKKSNGYTFAVKLLQNFEQNRSHLADLIKKKK